VAKRLGPFDVRKVPQSQKKHAKKEVSLAHMVRKVDVQPSHPGSSPHGRGFGFLLLKKHHRGFPYRIPL
jgi:hypothetical protein